MRSIFNELAEKHSFRKVAPDEHERFRDLHGKELLKALGLPLWKLPSVLTDMRKRMSSHADQFSLFDGIGDVLRHLSAAGIQLAIVSSNSRENVERILGSENAALIHHYACGASVFGKPAHLRAVLRRSGIPFSQAIYIGDEVRDAEAARKVGIAFGAVAWGQHSEAALRAQQPEEFFACVTEIAAKLG